MGKLADLLADEIRRAGIPGAALVAWKDDRVLTAAAGIADIEQPSSPVTVDTPFRIGSTTKPLTTAAILAAGLPLDDPLPWGMTLRRLLSHTGGMPTDPITPGNLYGPTAPDALARWADGLPRVRPDRTAEPGPWRYSNPGIALAAHVAEQATGVPVADLVDRLVLRPLGMTRTSWRLADAVAWAPAQGHEGSPAAVVRPAFDHAVYAAAGFAYSSAADLARFLRHVPAAMRVRHARTAGEELDGYGLGLYVGTRRGIPRHGHPGGIRGSGCQLQATDDGRAGVALVHNLQPDGGWTFAGDILDTLLEGDFR
ncbi:serine hydrolase domain-containing protein [Streptomyces sp. NPDC002073]|uniref:serine hydrolase domain-containing protein n=1 Tax=Streptomyces sp. NBC_00239 TaxID=2903640 RepID=UPI002E2A29CF|nr:serine hydrolase domain-containing protein [Streptomyces sp. NBC_00239]